MNTNHLPEYRRRLKHLASAVQGAIQAVDESKHGIAAIDNLNRIMADVNHTADKVYGQKREPAN